MNTLTNFVITNATISFITITTTIIDTSCQKKMIAIFKLFCLGIILIEYKVGFLVYVQ